MVVIDKLSKVAHFVAVKTTNSASEVSQIFIKEIVRLHGVPKKIISSRGAKFTSRFWKELLGGLGVELACSTTYQMQMNGKIESTNKIFDDIFDSKCKFASIPSTGFD